MSQAVEIASVPSSVQQKLRQIRRRQIVVTFVRAVAFAGAVLIATMLIAMLIDWSLNLFSSELRAGMTIASLLATVASLVAVATRPLREALRWTKSASIADRGVPQLEHRWTTVTESCSDARAYNETYQAMLSQVTSEAVALGSLVDPSKVVKNDIAKQAVRILALCVAGLILFLAVNWPRTSILLKRFWSFGGNITATSVHSLAGDLAVPRGDATKIAIETSGIPTTTAQLFVVEGVDPPEILELDVEKSGEFTYTFTSVQDDFTYRVRSGDGQTSWHQVTVLDRPSIESIRLVVDAPAYVDRPRYEKDHLPSRVKAIEGSTLTFEVNPNIPVDRMELSLTSVSTDGAEPQTRTLTLQPDEHGTYRYRATLLDNLVIRPKLISHDGLSNLDDLACRIQVIEDKAPVALVISPTDEIEINLDESLEIKFEAHDDHGVAKVELVVYEETDEKGEPKILHVEEVPLGDQRLERHVVSSVELKLSELNLEDDANISYAIRVTDNRSLGKNARKSHNNGGEPLEQDADNPNANQAIAKSDQEALTDESPRDSMQSDETDRKTRDNTNDLAAEMSPAGTELDPESRSDGASLNNDVAEPSRIKIVVADGDKQDTAEMAAQSASTDKAESTLADRSEPMDPRDSDLKVAGRQTPSNETPMPSEEQIADHQSIMASDSESESESATTDSGQANANAVNDDNRNSNQHTIFDQLAAVALPTSPLDEMSDTEQRRMLRRLLDLDVGQGSTSNRMRVHIRERMSDSGQAMRQDAKSHMALRKKLETIDAGLEIAETMLTKVSENAGKPNESPTRRSEQLNEADEQLQNVSDIIIATNEESRETPFAFIGLQLVGMGRSHITPARDRVLWVKRNPEQDVDGGRVKISSLEALSHTTQARDFLAGVMQRIETQKRHEKLADGLDEIATMYEIYIENAQQLLRQSQQNRNPLKRKMAIVEVDEAYLARRTEIEEMRRDMMAEFARLLADDPRLLRRYLDTIRRGQTSLRDRLTEASERQGEIAEEVAAWLQVDDTQREDLWRILVEMRLERAIPFATDASALADRTEASMPLGLDPSRGTPAMVIDRARQVAVAAQEVALVARHRLEADSSDSPSIGRMDDAAQTLYRRIGSLNSAFERLNFEAGDAEDVQAFLAERLAESNELADRSQQWKELAAGIEGDQYHAIAASDQQQLSQTTASLRADLDELVSGLENLFQRDELELPDDIRALIIEMNSVMEAVTMNQAAAVYTLSTKSIEESSEQLVMAVDRFQTAEELFDRIRRMTVEILDEQEVDNPNIADLREPTLDEFLARLEREPRLAQQLELGDRRQNLRVLTDWMLWQTKQGNAGSSQMRQLAQRARKRMEQMQQQQEGKPDPETQRTREEETENLREMLAASIKKLEQAAQEPETSEEAGNRMRQRAEQMRRMLEPLDKNKADQWSALVESEHARAMLRALARGEKLPDQQWNKLFSSLENGLWQVRGRTPPEAYRRAIEQYQEIIRQTVQ